MTRRRLLALVAFLRPPSLPLQRMLDRAGELMTLGRYEEGARVLAERSRLLRGL
jgi:hypothetical protein